MWCGWLVDLMSTKEMEEELEQEKSDFVFLDEGDLNEHEDIGSRTVRNKITRIVNTIETERQGLMKIRKGPEHEIRKF